MFATYLPVLGWFAILLVGILLFAYLVVRLIEALYERRFHHTRRRISGYLSLANGGRIDFEVRDTGREITNEIIRQRTIETHVRLPGGHGLTIPSDHVVGFTIGPKSSKWRDR